MVKLELQVTQVHMAYCGGLSIIKRITLSMGLARRLGRVAE